MLQRHANEGESIAEAIRDCLDYGKNPEKTEDGKYISSYECDPATVAAEFLLAKASYKAMTGREQKKGSDVLCYQIRQSFYPGEITPEEANRISYELAMRWTKGRHAFIVTTHTDKQHIHSHIYYNSTTLDCTRKFRNFWDSSFALRRLSDRLCLENGLSIVENPKPRSKGKFRNYGEWQAGQKKPLTYQGRLRAAIDTVLAKRPADFPAFLSLMEQAGYEVKQRRGAISFRAPGQSGLPACALILSGKVTAKRTYGPPCQAPANGPVSLAQKSVWLLTFNPGSKEKAPVMSDGPRCLISNKWPPPLLICKTTA